MMISNKTIFVLLSVLFEPVLSFASLYKGCVVPTSGFGIHKFSQIGFEGTPYSFRATDENGNIAHSYVLGQTYYISVLSSSGSPFRMTMIVDDGRLDSAEDDTPLCDGLRLNFLDYLTGHTASWVAGNQPNTTIQVVLADACTVQFIQGDLFMMRNDGTKLLPPSNEFDANDDLSPPVEELLLSLEEPNNL
eukprot:TRINITY_DN17506_c0_g1_i1.p2 TRINITY_DN17506_c0_g1~~TRINITY_DN17506_c0_g1_i1.p2  ORF type:complete len:191 (+),score=20.96 TRINITY_DN17506_c0_g1_i1:728-1300(+)